VVGLSGAVEGLVGFDVGRVEVDVGIGAVGEALKDDMLVLGDGK